jgi:hypothetical protein
LSNKPKLRRRHLASAVLLIIQTACSHQDGQNAPSAAQLPADASSFTSFVAQEMNARHPPHSIGATSPLLLSTQDINGLHIALHLDRIFYACQSDQARCPSFLEREFSGVDAMLWSRQMPLQSQALRTIVRSQEYLQDNAAERATMTEVVTPDAPPGLVALIYADLPRTMRSVASKELATLHLSPDAAYAIGLQNLQPELPPVDEAIRKLPPRPISVLGGGPYESSRILMHADWAHLSALYSDHLLVAVPAADEVLFTDGNSRRDSSAIMELASQEYTKAERGVSPAVFLWKPRGWLQVTPRP